MHSLLNHNQVIYTLFYTNFTKHLNLFLIIAIQNFILLNCIQYKCIEGIIYLQLSELEEKFPCFQRLHIQKYVDR